MVILKLSGVDDRNAAEAMKNKDIFITEDDLLELPEDTFYIRDLIGLSVIDEEGADSRNHQRRAAAILTGPICGQAGKRRRGSDSRRFRICKGSIP